VLSFLGESFITSTSIGENILGPDVKLEGGKAEAAAAAGFLRRKGAANIDEDD
jgi:hypothetical protein